MPGLMDVHDAGPPAASAFGVDEVYESPDRLWALHLRNQDEIRMGAYVWRSIDVAPRQASLPSARLALPNAAFWPLVGSYVPWDASSRRVVVATLRFDEARPTFGFAIFDVGRGTATEGHADGWVVGAAWSPKDDHLLLAAGHSIRVLSPDGRTEAAVDTDLGTTASVIGWTPSGSSFFCLQTEAGESALRFFDATGQRVAEAPLDPAALVPYDATEYAELDRSRYCLKLGAGAWASGSLLDNWSTAEYDATQSAIHLTIYRPMSAVQTFRQSHGGEVVGCEVRPRRITATVVD